MRGFNAVRAAVAVLGIMAFASGAFAQTGSEGKELAPGQWTGQRMMGVGPDSAQHLLRTDASGNVSFSDAARDRDSWILVSNIIANNALTLAARADSVAVPIDIHKYKRVALAFYGLVDSLTTRATLAVECRCHGSASADTASSYVIEPWNARATGTVAWADSFGVTGATPLGDLAVAGPGEASWVLQPKPSLPHIRLKQLLGPDSPPCPYLTVRLRLLTLAGGNRVRVRVHLLGSSL